MQEALQNISSHAQASCADVIIAFAPRTLKLTVFDDGQGFDLLAVQQNNKGSLGLLGMRERAESLGGRLTVQTEPGQGTRVELLVPVQQVQDDDNASD